MLSKISIQNKVVNLEKIDGDRVPCDNHVMDFGEKAWIIFNSKPTSKDEEKLEILSKEDAFNKLKNTLITNRQDFIEKLQNEIDWLKTANL